MREKTENFKKRDAGEIIASLRREISEVEIFEKRVRYFLLLGWFGCVFFIPLSLTSNSVTLVTLALIVLNF